MNRIEAQEAFMEGKKVRHESWEDDGYLQYKDGCALGQCGKAFVTAMTNLFFGLAVGYDDGWEIIKPLEAEEQTPRRYGVTDDPELKDRFAKTCRKIVEQGGVCKNIQCEDCPGADMHNTRSVCRSVVCSGCVMVYEKIANCKRWLKENGFDDKCATIEKYEIWEATSNIGLRFTSPNRALTLSASALPTNPRFGGFVFRKEGQDDYISVSPVLLDMGEDDYLVEGEYEKNLKGCVVRADAVRMFVEGQK